MIQTIHSIGAISIPKDMHESFMRDASLIMHEAGMMRCKTIPFNGDTVCVIRADTDDQNVLKADYSYFAALRMPEVTVSPKGIQISGEIPDGSYQRGLHALLLLTQQYSQTDILITGTRYCPDARILAWLNSAFERHYNMDRFCDLQHIEEILYANNIHPVSLAALLEYVPDLYGSIDDGTINEHMRRYIRGRSIADIEAYISPEVTNEYVRSLLKPWKNLIKALPKYKDTQTIPVLQQISKICDYLQSPDEIRKQIADQSSDLDIALRDSHFIPANDLLHVLTLIYPECDEELKKLFRGNIYQEKDDPTLFGNSDEVLRWMRSPANHTYNLFLHDEDAVFYCYEGNDPAKECSTSLNSWIKEIERDFNNTYLTVFSSECDRDDAFKQLYNTLESICDTFGDIFLFEDTMIELVNALDIKTVTALTNVLAKIADDAISIAEALEDTSRGYSYPLLVYKWHAINEFKRFYALLHNKKTRRQFLGF